MAYVDLNPIRAGMAVDLEGCLYTSVRRRADAARRLRSEPSLQPIVTAVPPPRLGLRSAEYLELVDWTGRLVMPGKRGRIDPATSPVLGTITEQPRRWQCDVLGIESRYWRAVGAVDVLLEKAAAMG